ncbi:MAG: helix-turn-helix domain-containing protein [Planctomycetaceae bacterium]|nr:helix-turn-helix domain-containing protein [Planctomycetaceae bacterium]
MTLTRVTLRELTAEERQALEQLAASRTAQARFVERAQILLAIADGRRPSQVAKDLGISRPTVYTWIHRFNSHGFHGLEDQPRAGRPPTSTAEQRAEVIAAALTDPKRLGLPFSFWTLDRLQAYLNEQKSIPIKRTRIDEILLGEGLKWRQQETWFGARVDPEFAEKRGHRDPLHEAAGGLGRRLSRREGAGGGRSRPRASRDSNSSAPNPDPTPTATPSRQGGPSKRSITGGAARGPSSAPSARPPARRSPAPSPAGRRPTGPTSWRKSRRGSRAK